MKCDLCNNEASVFTTTVVDGDVKSQTSLCSICAVPSFLPVRLKRETPFRSQLGCTAALAVVLLGMGAFGYFAGKWPPEKHSWVAYLVGGAFGFFGLLLLWSFIRQLAAAGIRETMVELSTEPLQPGQGASICVIQPGPAKLKSLRANLLCFEERRFTVRNTETHNNEKRTAQKLISTENLLEAKHLNVPAGDVWHETREFSLPADAPTSGTQNGVTISWKIEVWGTGYWLASFMHPFGVDVFQGQRPTEEDEEEQEEKRPAQ
jgi:hypothetical protein